MGLGALARAGALILLLALLLTLLLAASRSTSLRHSSRVGFGPARGSLVPIDQDARKEAPSGFAEEMQALSHLIGNVTGLEERAPPLRVDLAKEGFDDLAAYSLDKDSDLSFLFAPEGSDDGVPAQDRRARLEAQLPWIPAAEREEALRRLLAAGGHGNGGGHHAAGGHHGPRGALLDQQSMDVVQLWHNPCLPILRDAIHSAMESWRKLGMKKVHTVSRYLAWASSTLAGVADCPAQLLAAQRLYNKVHHSLALFHYDAANKQLDSAVTLTGTCLAAISGNNSAVWKLQTALKLSGGVGRFAAALLQAGPLAFYS
eukprot:SM002407S08563  [mRNA]  locus=s2407:1:1392:- [translate_table: standard]